MISQTKETFQFDTIDDVVSDIAKGRIVIVTDDADRENEGDLVMAAEKVTPEAVNFMATHGRGLICAPISNERAEQLGLQRMVTQNREMYRTDFTVSVDAARGVNTRISARRSRATRSCLSPAGEGWRRTAPGWSHRGGCRSCQHGWTATGRSALRDSASRRHDGAVAGTDGVPQKTLPAHLHDSKFDCASPRPGKARGAGTDRKNADRLRRFRFTLVPREARWPASSRAGERRDRREQTDTGARAQPMSHRRRFRFTPMRLWKSIARGAAANPGRRQRGSGVHAAGRPRHRVGRKNSRLQIARGRTRYGGGKYQARLP